MKPLMTVVSILALTASAWAAKPVPNQNLPKNLAAPNYRVAVSSVVPNEFTKKDIRTLAANAETAGDHLKIASFYRGEAETLDVKAEGYERAAAAFRSGPMVKNVAAPTTAGRWEFAAKGLREEATSNRALAATHEATATDTPAGF